MPDLPDLGVGIVYLPGLEPVLEARSAAIDVIEVEPQPLASYVDGSYKLREDIVSRLNALPQAKLVHGVGAPVGGKITEESLVEPFVEAVVRLAPSWASEHLTFNRVKHDGSSFFTGFMLPPLQTMESVELAVENIRRIQDRIGVPFAFETPVNYMRPRADEMTDGAFFAEVALRADCGILLDLHNVWCNERNGRQPLASLMTELPLDRVLEMHLADGRQVDGYWVDAHSGLISDDLFALAETVIPQLPNLKAIMFEIMPDYMIDAGITVRDVTRQAERMQRIWEQRGSARTAVPPTANREPGRSKVTVSQWERTLGALVAGQDGGDEALRTELAQDAGTSVYRKMAESVRSGMIAEVLTLTFRLLMLSCGEQGVHEHLNRFWGGETPKQAAVEEARSFADWLGVAGVGVPHAAEVAAFEIAAIDVTMSGEEQIVAFSCDPMVLLTALGEGRLPDELAKGSYEIALEPEAALG